MSPPLPYTSHSSVGKPSAWQASTANYPSPNTAAFQECSVSHQLIL